MTPTITENERDGRILPTTHWASLVVFMILALLYRSLARQEGRSDGAV